MATQSAQRAERPLSTPLVRMHGTCRKVKDLRDNLRKIAADLEPAPTALLAGLQWIHRDPSSPLPVTWLGVLTAWQD